MSKWREKNKRREENRRLAGMVRELYAGRAITSFDIAAALGLNLASARAVMDRMVRDEMARPAENNGGIQIYEVAE